MFMKVNKNSSFVNTNAENVYRDVIFPFLKNTGIAFSLLEMLLPEKCKAKRVRDGEKYRYEDHTYTIASGNLFTPPFDQVITDIYNRKIMRDTLLGTYFASYRGVFSACIAPAIVLADMFTYKSWQTKIFNNSYEPEVLFKTLPFEEIRGRLSGSNNIPFMFWSSKKNHFEISNAMRFG